MVAFYSSRWHWSCLSDVIGLSFTMNKPKVLVFTNYSAVVFSAASANFYVQYVKFWANHVHFFSNLNLFKFYIIFLRKQTKFLFVFIKNLIWNHPRLCHLFFNTNYSTWHLWAIILLGPISHFNQAWKGGSNIKKLTDAGPGLSCRTEFLNRFSKF